MVHISIHQFIPLKMKLKLHHALYIALVFVILAIFVFLFCQFMVYSPPTELLVNHNHKSTRNFSSAAYTFKIDEKLKKAARNYNANIVSRAPHNSSKTQMNSIHEIVQLTLPETIQVVKPCNGNQGKGLLAVIYLFCRPEDFQRRTTIRETYGSSLKKSTMTEIYFVVSRVYNQM